MVAAMETTADPIGQLFDIVSYAITLLGLFVVISAVLATLLGTPVASGVKYGLFVFGWATFGYSVYLLYPTSAWKREDPDDVDNTKYDPFGVPPAEETKIQSLVQRIPPARFKQIKPIHRLPTGLRMFVAALFVLGTSIILGQVFGIGP